MKARYVDIGIINMIRQWLKDIELQRWLSKINNNTRKDANQSREPITVHERISFRLLCFKVFFPDAAIMENKKTPGDKVVVHV